MDAKKIAESAAVDTSTLGGKESNPLPTITNDQLMKASGAFSENKQKIADALKGFAAISPQDVSRSSWGETGAGVLGFLSGLAGGTISKDEKPMTEYQKSVENYRKYKMENAQQDQATGIRKEYENHPTVKNFIGKAQAFNDLSSIAQKGSPAADMGLVYSFMRSLDPASTVRETEYASAAAATSLWGKAMNYLQKVDSGQLLNEDQRKDFVDTARMLALNGAAVAKKTVVPFYSNIAQKYGVDPALVIQPLDNYFAAPDVENLKTLMRSGKFSPEILASGKTSILNPGNKQKPTEEQIALAKKAKADVETNSEDMATADDILKRAGLQ